ncbi:hypothetical protein [uncultured Tenacibaculum sp.]|uniref:hypothetical protein n=1 Tax=uncultured Tenacibaculum sp. TaxID=174713 RepID=UPI00260EF9E2|nr:hypothetical protein [uncultured Tenacibaculum sp.]
MLWTDKFELEFNKLVRPIEFLKLIGISLVGLVFVEVLTIVFRKLNIESLKTRIGIVVVFILIINSYFYIDYGMRIYSNKITNSEFGEGALKKISNVGIELAYGTQAENLTGKEYLEITKIKWFPKLPIKAKNISFRYDYDGFLPDYSFSLSYDLPKEMKVDTMNYKDGTFSKSQNFKVIGDRKRVIYHEGQW